jgi:DNA-binding CsgD family transcriptional regulator
LESEKAPRNHRGFRKSVEVWLLKQKGKTGPEIASALGINSGSVRRILYRIRKTYLGRKDFESAVELAKIEDAKA